jgi:hypothetical protein
MNNYFTAIMQPYFFPYLGYFNLVKHSSNFVFYDLSNFKRKSWISRNIICNPMGDNKEYIRPAIKEVSSLKSLNQIRINNKEKWKSKILNNLLIFKGTAYFEEGFNVVEKILKNDFEFLSEFNMYSIIQISNSLDFKTKFLKINEILPELNHKDYETTELAIQICKTLDSNVYINLPNGIKYFKNEKFKLSNIDFGIISESKLILDFRFNNLSILFYLLNFGIERTKEIIKYQYKITWIN